MTDLQIEIKVFKEEENNIQSKMNNMRKRLIVVQDKRKAKEREYININRLSIESSNKLKCMSKDKLKECIKDFEKQFIQEKDFKNIGAELYGYDITAEELIKDEVFIDLFIVNVGDNLINKVFGKVDQYGFNKNTMKQFYRKQGKKDIISHIKQKYKDRYYSKATAYRDARDIDWKNNSKKGEIYIEEDVNN